MEMKDLEARTELSKVLGAPRVYQYGSDKETIYSWAEIFNHIGRLQERATYQREDITYGKPEMDVDSVR